MRELTNLALFILSQYGIFKAIGIFKNGGKGSRGGSNKFIITFINYYITKLHLSGSIWLLPELCYGKAHTLKKKVKMKEHALPFSKKQNDAYLYYNTLNLLK